MIRSQPLAPDTPFLVYASPLGNDANSGTSIAKPVRTIARAVEIANAWITDESKRALISIIGGGSGAYTETNLPIRVKRNVAIKGDKLRSVIIRPAAGQELKGFFKVDSGFMAWGLTLQGHQADESGNQAWAFSFDELADNTAIGAVGLGAYILASPYIQNCTSLTAEDDGGLAGSVSVGSTGGGMEVDGNKCAINSPIRSMVVDSFTQVNLGGPGCLVKNDGYAQLVSFFGTFCTYHVRSESGGQVNLSGGGTTDFGTYGLMADGYSPRPLYTGGARVAAYGATRVEKAVTIDVTTNTFTAFAHGFIVGDQVKFSVSQGNLPNNSATNTTYFVIASGLTINNFRVSATLGGSTLDLSGTATGTYSVIRQGATEVDIVDFTANRLGRQIKYPSAGSLGSSGNPVTISARGGPTVGSSFTVTLGTSTISHEYTGGGTVTVGGTSYPITSATYNNATGVTVLTATGYAPTVGASITLAGLSFICNSASRPNAGQLMFPQLVFPRNASTGVAQAKTFAYTRTGNFTLTYQETASPNGPDHEYVSGGTAIIGNTNYGVVTATYNKTTGLVTLTTKNQLPAGNGNVTVEGLVFICPSSAYIVTSSIPIDSNGNTVANDAANRAGYRVLFYSGVNGGLKDSIAAGQRLDFRNRSQVSAPSHTFEFVGSGTNYTALPWNGGVSVPANGIIETNNGRVYSSNTNEKGDFAVGTQFTVDGTTGSVTINTDQFNLSGLNFIGPFSRNGGISTVGEQLREVSNNPALIASTGTADGNTVPTQAALIGYLTNRTITGGAGLTGGGNLVANQVINVNLKTNGGLALESNQIAIDLSATNITGTLGFADGGTSATNQQTAINALVGAVTSGQYLRGNGTNVLLSAIQAGDLPVVPENKGGTGLTALGTGVTNFLATPSASNLAAAVTEETGTGALVFANSPALAGVPTAPTASTATNSTQIATTAFVSAAVNNLINGAPGALDTLNELAAAMGNDANFATTVTNSLALKAALASPAFTGTPSAPTAVIDTNTTQLATTAFVIGQGYIKSAVAASIYAPLASPTFTGTVTGVTKAMVGLGNVDNTSDANKPISTATQSALDFKAPLASPTFTGTVSGISKAMVGLSNVDNTSDLNKPVSTTTQAALDLKANLSSPTFTGVPLAPTAAAGTNTTQIATTAFVSAAITTATGGSITGVFGTSPVLSSGGSAPTISLASAYGDTQNPFGAKAPGLVFAGPATGSNLVPTFRALVATDIPTLNQNTTGQAGSIANAITFNNSGSGAASGSTFNGSAAATISYNTVGAPSTSGTNATGTWSISITGNAATVTNGVVTTGTYADPAWITSLSASKLSGPILLLERTAQTAAYTLALADAGQVVVMSAASAVTLTVPDNATVAFAIGTVINIYNTSASTLTIAGASGVTVQNNSAGLSQYQEISIRKRAANEWVRVG